MTMIMVVSYILQFTNIAFYHLQLQSSDLSTVSITSLSPAI